MHVCNKCKYLYFLLLTYFTCRVNPSCNMHRRPRVPLNTTHVLLPGNKQAKLFVVLRSHLIWFELPLNPICAHTNESVFPFREYPAFSPPTFILTVKLTANITSPYVHMTQCNTHWTHYSTGANRVPCFLCINNHITAAQYRGEMTELSCFI